MHNIREYTLNLKELSEVAKRARAEIATWPKSEQKLVKAVHDSFTRRP